MDKVQRFIEENQYQLGYIMQEASRRWIKNDPVGALTEGAANGLIEKYGTYCELLDKVERYEDALKKIESHKIGVFTSTDMRILARDALTEKNQ
ncbi:hypothetical protein [Exiguobacterium sp. s21]|uniref:hypothetical protein n=1 Tax=Exiguobacterium sp. s21 TaxID=2751244 RepID=UPI001BEA7F46|nr:hypothetical protein [Exiguobacterium sp. s21]